MAMTSNWVGTSGKAYTYQVYELPITFESRQKGNFAFARLDSGRRWVPVFVGEGDLGKHVDANNYQFHLIQQRGATHVHVRLNPDVHDRRSEVRDLLGLHKIAFEPYGCNPAMA